MFDGAIIGFIGFMGLGVGGIVIMGFMGFMGLGVTGLGS